MKTRVKALVGGLAAIGLAAGTMLALAPSGTAAVVAPTYVTTCHATPYYDRGYLTAHPNYGANNQDNPCVDAVYNMVTTGPITLIPGIPSLHIAASGVNAAVLHGETSFASLPAATSGGAIATAASVALAVPGLTLLAHGLYSSASATMSGGLCNDEVTTGFSSLADLTINGKAINVNAGPITINLGLIKIWVDRTVRVGNTVTQQALNIELGSPANDIVVAEASAGIHCLT